VQGILQESKLAVNVTAHIVAARGENGKNEGAALILSSPPTRQHDFALSVAAMELTQGMARIFLVDLPDH
jgi:hypothetical protein